MKQYLLRALVVLSVATPFVFSQTNIPTQAPVPEEARRHFVMGITLFKEAKTADDYSQVEGEFKQAVELAPQWPDARYNLALTEEADGNYSGAVGDLKLYQEFKLSETEARTVQDKIYVLEAKQLKKVTDAQAAKVDAAARAEEAKYNWLQGEWSYESEYQGWGPNYGAATGTAQAEKIRNVVEFGPINDYGRPRGYLRATVGESGNISWDFRYLGDNCNQGIRPVTLTVGQGQRTIRFQVDSYSGAQCNSNLPFIVMLTRR